MKILSHTTKILIGFLIYSVPIRPQSVVFTYDQAGNRISRVIVLETVQKTNRLPVDTVKISPSLEGVEIKIYPNPTLGELNVNIFGTELQKKCSILVFNADGLLLINQEAICGENVVNMNRYQPGWYILQLKINDKIQEYKILKK